ncbi:restriction endonuclease subunit S [Streptomyces sp. NBC_00059]|uniref:restriction endonuclease subunit S n=1 Tax=Streptomyces sp. NBC_00059 TaxID=2975635 RepID=UPI00225A9D64|nr:restriction endonuclease subunit S [Streptomyces sp. NBC_00059]MCX5415312.1 restriction endonuclease subunit S [Streptomyces sp. NBC_00059]
MTFPRNWQTQRSRFLFDRRDVRGADAPLASATKTGVALRSDLEYSVWNPNSDVSNYKLVEPDDFVIGLRSFQHGISHSAVRGIVSPAYTVLRPRDSLDARFVKHYFRSNLLISHLANITQGIRQGQAIDIEAFKDLTMPVPSLEEQRRIADFLDVETSKIDGISSLAEEAGKLSRARRTAVIDWELSRIPDSYVIPAGRACDAIYDCVNKTAPITNTPTPFRMIRTSNIRMGRVDVEETFRVTEQTFKEWNRRGAPRAGDILFTRQAPVGEAGLLTSNAQVFLGQQVMLYRPNIEVMLPQFLLLNFLSSFMKRQFALASDGAAHAHMRVHDCLKLRVYRPALDIQTEIIDRVSSSLNHSDALHAATTRQVALLAERRQALVTAAVTGQFDVSTASGRNVTDGVQA